MSERAGRDVLLKLECLQQTGSFKVRGASARLEALDSDERARGVVACSSGNHGRAIAFVAGRLDVPATVFVPEWVDPVKLDGITAAGADARREGKTFDESEASAIGYAAAQGMTYVSAYDDPWVIAGQGTLASEILEQAGDSPSGIVVPLSGGGLVGGIAAALQLEATGGGAATPRVIAVSARNAAVMLASVKAGRPVDLPEEDTLASALAGGIGLDNRYSFALVRDLVDEHRTVTEEEIAFAMRYAVERLRVVLEGGGAVGLAACLAAPEGIGRALPEDGPLVLLLSGGNVAAGTLAAVLEGAPSSDVA